MEDYKVEDYGAFDTAVSTTNKFNNSVEQVKAVATTSKTTVADGGSFKGPAAEGCAAALEGLSNTITGSMDNYKTINKFLNGVSENYKISDEKAKQYILSVGGESGFGTSPKSVMAIPEDLKQRGYTVTCYEADGWHLGGSSSPTGIAPGTGQEAVHNKWNEQGSNYTHDIATMDVNGKNCYLVATSEEVGKVGDVINVKLKNGQSFPAVVADQKSKHDSNYSIYGHTGGGGTNVIEFEVKTSKYNSSGNPNTKDWGLEWDSSSGVKEIENYGSIIK